MKLPQRMLTFAVLLIGAMVALSEIPEILTLTDNVSNDYVSARTGGDGSRLNMVQDHPGKVPAAAVLFRAPMAELQGLADKFVSSSSKSSRTLLLLLVTQRK